MPYDWSVDIWALGILLFFMLYAEYPFRGYDVNADIERRCHYGFNVKEVISKPEKLK
jgi:serine/threonine protein kinase